jgi:hypothetical protein
VRPSLAEQEANQFAGELLVPAEAALREIVPPVTLTTLADLKLRWGVSLQALVHRARDLGIITQRQYAYLFEQIGARGWRLREPPHLDIPVEKPRLVRKMAEELYPAPDGGIDCTRLAAETELSVPRLKDVLDVHASRHELPKRSAEAGTLPANVVPFPRARGTRQASGR